MHRAGDAQKKTKRKGKKNKDAIAKPHQTSQTIHGKCKKNKKKTEERTQL